MLLLLGLAVALPLSMEGGCSPTSGPAANVEPMELWGRWQGMTLASVDSPTAQNLGIPGVVAGVVVGEMRNEVGARAAQAGILVGDVIVRVDGNQVTNLAELYTLTTRLDVMRALPLEILRQGQPMSVLLPPPVGAAAPAPMMAPSTPAQQASMWSGPTQAAQPMIAPQPPMAQQPVPTLPPTMTSPPPSVQPNLQQPGVAWPATALVPGVQAPMGR